MCLVRKRGEAYPRVTEYIRGTYDTGENEEPHSYKTYVTHMKSQVFHVVLTILAI